LFDNNLVCTLACIDVLYRRMWGDHSGKRSMFTGIYWHWRIS